MVASSLRIATDRERNCARDEDKTTHADKPFDRNVDPFSQPAMSAAERRRQIEISVGGTRISKRAKEKHQIGFSQEHENRKAANEELALQRGDLSIKDFNKGNQMQMELEKKFVPLEPVAEGVKRFCRAEAARMWSCGCNHAKQCKAGGACQFRVKDRSVNVLAEVVLQCTLESLSQGACRIEHVEQGHVLTLITKLRSQNQHASMSCGYRAVEHIVRRLLAHGRASAPIPECPSSDELAQYSRHSSPASTSQSATATPQRSGSASDAATSASAALAKAGPVPMTHQTSLPDLEETADLLRLRDAIGKMCRHTLRAGNIQRAALQALQHSSIRVNLKDTKLNTNEVAFCIIDAVHVKVCGTSVPDSCRPTKIKQQRVQPQIEKILHLLPDLTEDLAEDDGLF